MLFKFEEFYDAKPDYYVVADGKVFRITSKLIEVLGPISEFKIPTEAKAISLDDWKALHLPLAIDLLYSDAKPEEPEEPERELTEAEARLDDEYERTRREWLACGLERAVEVLAAHREDPIFISLKTHTESQEYSCPLLIDALTAALRVGPGPVDPIGWRRRQPRDGGGVAEAISGALENAAQVFGGLAARRAQAAASQAAQAQAQAKAKAQQAQQAPTPREEEEPHAG